MPNSLTRLRPATPLAKTEQDRLLRVPAEKGVQQAVALALLIAVSLTFVLARIGWPPSEDVDYAAWAYWLLFLGPGVTAGALAGGFSLWVERNLIAAAPQLHSLVDVEARRLNWQAERAALPAASSPPSRVHTEVIEFVAERAWLLPRDGDASPGALLHDGAQCLLLGTLPLAMHSAGHHQRARWKVQRFARTQGLWTALARGDALAFTELSEEFSANVHPQRVELLAPEQLPSGLAMATVGLSEGYR